MAPASTISENPFNGVVSQVGKELESLQSKILFLESENKKLSQKAAEAQAKANELKPELLAKFSADIKATAQKEKELLAKKAPLAEALAKAKAAYDKANGEYAAVINELSALNSNSETAAALLYAKMDLYTSELKDKTEAALERAKVEKSKAETDRQAANDLITKAEAQMEQIKTSGKETFAKIAKAEAEAKIKMEARSEEMKRMDTEKNRLEKQLQFLADLVEKNKKFEQAVKK